MTDDARQKPLRHSMPKVAEFIDAMRDAFGDRVVNAAYKASRDGLPTFYAAENGLMVGSLPPACGARFTVDQLHLDDFPSIPA
ncbi:hypothetical protein [Accumulibacter sp.]|jgi:hypothetical protein|uniref:hypothetical protein n=1 Tax=Accumulibacter sp. TaxID=2053492 RepID=UPI002CBD6664|nr:hypothetical protein [Accumulibacter sp.]HRF06320.1 hypothetical protein [Accumulibacter sp.]